MQEKMRDTIGGFTLSAKVSPFCAFSEIKLHFSVKREEKGAEEGTALSVLTR